MGYQYRSVAGGLDKSRWHGEAVFAFGDARVDAGIPADRVFRLPVKDGAGDQAPAVLDPAVLRHGVVFALPDGADEAAMAMALDIQKRIIHAHYKYVVFPGRSHVTADPLGVRRKTHPDVLRSLNVLRNHPWLLNAPIADKLAEARVGLPVLLLLPGPSVREVLPRLAALRERCLVVCIARTLGMCLAAGVMPDFVVQLDTYQVQRHFYEDAPAMPQTTLVPLSLTPFHGYARKFRGVVMMDSFNPEALPNRARLRESYVSSLTACLGLAEALHAPHAFVAGANLSSPAPAGASPAWQGVCPVHYDSALGRHLLSDRNGQLVESEDWYIATATEADLFAQGIAQTTGTRFYSTTGSTLLSERWYPHAPPETMAALPPIDRAAFLRTMDAVLARREAVDIARVRVHLLRQLQEVRRMESVLAGEGEEPERAEVAQAVADMARTMRDVPVGPDTDVAGVGARLCAVWRLALNNARLLVQGVAMAGRGKPLPLLCLAGEEDAVRETYGRHIPGAQWQVHHVVTQAYPAGPGATPVHSAHLLAWLDNHPVVFPSARVHREFSYIFDLAPGENLYDPQSLFD